MKPYKTRIFQKMGRETKLICWDNGIMLWGNVIKKVKKNYNKY
jgi:hypothetical protein